MLPLIFGGKTRKMLVDHPKYGKIWVDFFIILEKSVEYFAPNTDWNSHGSTAQAKHTSENRATHSRWHASPQA